MTTIRDRLEYLRSELRAERISYDGIHELQGYVAQIDPADVELLEAAGVPEALLPALRRANALPDTEAKLAEAVELLRTLSIDPESDGITRIRAFLDKVNA